MLLFLKLSHHSANIALVLWVLCAEAYMKKSIDPTTRGHSCFCEVGGCNEWPGATRFGLCVLLYLLIYRVYSRFYVWQIFFRSWNTCNIKMNWQNSRWISLHNSQNDTTGIWRIVINKAGYPVLRMLAFFRWPVENMFPRSSLSCHWMKYSCYVFFITSVGIYWYTQPCGQPSGSYPPQTRWNAVDGQDPAPVDLATSHLL